MKNNRTIQVQTPISLPSPEIPWKVIRKGLLTRTQCEALVDYAQTHDHIVYDRNRLGKKVGVRIDNWNVPHAAFPDVTARLATAFAESNVWGLHLQGIADDLHVLRYTRGCFTRPHGDYDPRVGDFTKIIAIVYLGHPRDFSGGTLTLAESETIQALPQGSAVLFPGFCLHGVSPVTRGQRFVLSARAFGPPLC